MITVKTDNIFAKDKKFFYRDGELIGWKDKKNTKLLKDGRDNFYIPLNHKRYDRLLKASWSDKRAERLYNSFTFDADGEQVYMIVPKELLL